MLTERIHTSKYSFFDKLLAIDYFLIFIVIMIGAIIIAHSNWGIFFGEKVLFTSEQIFLLLLGIYFAIKGNDR